MQARETNRTEAANGGDGQEDEGKRTWRPEAVRYVVPDDVLSFSEAMALGLEADDVLICGICGGGDHSQATGQLYVVEMADGREVVRYVTGGEGGRIRLTSPDLEAVDDDVPADTVKATYGVSGVLRSIERDRVRLVGGRAVYDRSPSGWQDLCLVCGEAALNCDCQYARLYGQAAAIVRKEVPRFRDGDPVLVSGDLNVRDVTPGLYLVRLRDGQAQVRHVGREGCYGLRLHPAGDVPGQIVAGEDVQTLRRITPVEVAFEAKRVAVEQAAVPIGAKP